MIFVAWYSQVACGLLIHLHVLMYPAIPRLSVLARNCRSIKPQTNFWSCQIFIRTHRQYYRSWQYFDSGLSLKADHWSKDISPVDTAIDSMQPGLRNPLLFNMALSKRWWFLWSGCLQTIVMVVRRYWGMLSDFVLFDWKLKSSSTQKWCMSYGSMLVNWITRWIFLILLQKWRNLFAAKSHSS